MSEFRNESWEKRYERMGDEAESHFEAYAERVLRRGIVRFGLSRPPIQLGTIPRKIRYSPDYLMSKYFVEVQGVGREQKLRVKLDKWHALQQWHDERENGFLGVYFYVWDSHFERESFFPLNNLGKLIDQGKATIGFFPEGKAYFQFNVADVFDVEGA